MDSEDIKTTQDRQAFRIDDEVAVQIYIPKPSELSLNNNEIAAKMSSADDENGQDIAADYYKLGEKLNELYAKMSLKDPDSAMYLSTLNAKVDLLSSVLFKTDRVQQKKINISVGGVGFHYNKEFEINTIVFFKLTFPQKNYSIYTKARVVNIRYLPKKNPINPFLIGFQFIELNPNDENFLSKHVMEIQIAERAKQNKN